MEKKRRIKYHKIEVDEISECEQILVAKISAYNQFLTIEKSY